MSETTDHIETVTKHKCACPFCPGPASEENIQLYFTFYRLGKLNNLELESLTQKHGWGPFTFLREVAVSCHNCNEIFVAVKTDQEEEIILPRHWFRNYSPQEVKPKSKK